MNANQAKNLLAAARIYARKSSQVHGSRPLQMNAHGKYIPPPKAPMPFHGAVKVPVLKPYERPVFENWATNIHTDNPPMEIKNPRNPRDLNYDYVSPYEFS
jgi:hypothetical protein